MDSKASAVLSRNLRERMPIANRASGLYYYRNTGEKVLDGCGGSAVACLGHGDARVASAIITQIQRVSYCHSQFFTTPVHEELATAIINSTDGKMSKFLTLSSGSEALEAALKLARQYYLEISNPQPQRTKFIARQPSYHGATLTALSVGGHLDRRLPFEPLLSGSIGKVSQCNAYRGLLPAESAEQYVARLAAELDAEFCRLNPDSVCAFVAETVTGASTGCVPPVEGYWPAMKKICQKHGALLILDEVMCGMGRTGTLHAWQQEGIVPNIQVIGKSLGGGYIPVSGVLVDHEIAMALLHGSARFSHGQSFQAHPVACAAALAVQKIILEDDLLRNVITKGEYLSSQLRERLGSHPNVGDIRGRGLFWAVEFVLDKATATPFAPSRSVADSLCALAAQAPFNLSVYPGKGTIDGIMGDHILLAPAYNITLGDVENIVSTLAAAIAWFFKQALETNDEPPALAITSPG